MKRVISFCSVMYDIDLRFKTITEAEKRNFYSIDIEQ